MVPTYTKKRISFLSLALGSLIVTSLSTGNAEAGWSGPRCTAQCSKLYIGNSNTKLNDCATNCDNTKMIDILYPNYYKLNPVNVEHFLDALKYQQSIKQKEHTIIESNLKTEMGKKKPSTSKQKELHKKQEKLASEINKLGLQIQKISAHHATIQGNSSNTPPKEEATEHSTSLPEKQAEETKAPKRSKSRPRSTRSTSKLPSSEETKTPEHSTDGSDISSKPPTYEPPALPSHLATQHPTDEKLVTEGVHEHQEPEKDKTPEHSTGGPDISKPPTYEPPALPSHLATQHPTDEKPTEDVHGHQEPTKGHEEPSNQPKQPLSLLEQIQAAKDLKLKKVQTKESPNIEAGKVIGSNQPTTETAEQPSAKQPGGPDQPKQPLSLLEQIQAGKQLRKVDPEAEAKRKAAAEAEANENPMQKALKEAMAKRNASMNQTEEKVNPEHNFEQNWDD